MDEMIKLYAKKRKDMEKQIQNDLTEIQDTVLDIVEVGDYFSIKDDMVYTITVVKLDDKKQLTIQTENEKEPILFNQLSLVNNPDLIKWVIAHDNYIIEGFKEVLINAVRNGETILNTLKLTRTNYLKNLKKNEQ
ncbi:MAG: hypothetical protein Q4Q23_05315 [Methanobacteriaceae archaeon]|nr:hypothetical protein [Methanobacteriaceae archaeon]